MTAFQRRTKKRHDKVVALYRSLAEREGMARSEIFDTISARTGYTRQAIYIILRKRGLDYRKQ